MRRSETLFYAWHWYGQPKSVEDAIANMEAISVAWDMPTFATEFFDTAPWHATSKAGISHTYWHYSSFCTTGPAFGNRKVPEETFGACILGWDGGRSTYP